MGLRELAQPVRCPTRWVFVAARRCRSLFARSSVRRRDAESPFPPRLMKYWTMRTADPSPFGETSLRAIVRAIFAADPVKVLFGGCVESVFTRRTQRRFDRAA